MPITSAEMHSDTVIDTLESTDAILRKAEPDVDSNWLGHTQKSAPYSGMAHSAGPHWK